MSLILGISAFYHDSSACLLNNGKIIAAAQEERFTRKKHDPSYPFHSIEFLLNYSNFKLSQIDQIVFFEKPFLKFERLLETYLAFAPRGFSSFCKAMPVWIGEKLFQKKFLFSKLKQHDDSYISDSNIFFSDHHLSHAASAFFPSPFSEAAILTADGVGEWPTTTIAIGIKNKIEIKKKIQFPHSLGLLYSAFTYYLGFKVNSGEYKIMGLAPYGNPIYVDKIFQLIDIKNDGSFRLNQEYFNYATGLTMTNEKFHNLFGQKPRDASKDQLNQFHMDIAASIQNVTENIMIKIARYVRAEYGLKNLCLSGGVALNCVANGKILKENIFDNIWIQPASGDAGGSLGAALALWYIDQNNNRVINSNDNMSGSYLGPEYSDDDIEKILNKIGAKYEKLSYDEIIEKTATYLAEDCAIGWFQGKMEFGPRALGNRSILANPMSDNMQKNLNLKIKFRESFRPFAPSILENDCDQWFNLKKKSPYMLFVGQIKDEKKLETSEKKTFGIERLNEKRSAIPAVTHVDYTARIQTVSEKTNQKYFHLLTKFKEKTGCPILVNTSFNVRGEPIVNTPLDAYNCFMGTNLDYLVINNFILNKSLQNKENKTDYSKKFELD